MDAVPQQSKTEGQCHNERDNELHGDENGIRAPSLQDADHQTGGAYFVRLPVHLRALGPSKYLPFSVTMEPFIGGDSLTFISLTQEWGSARAAHWPRLSFSELEYGLYELLLGKQSTLSDNINTLAPQTDHCRDQLHKPSPMGPKPRCVFGCTTGSFKTKEARMFHYYLHVSKNIKNACPWQTCLRGFALETYKLRHQHVHTGKKPYRCNYRCSEAFEDIEGLVEHEKSVHNRYSRGIQQTSVEDVATSRRHEEHDAQVSKAGAYMQPDASPTSLSKRTSSKQTRMLSQAPAEDAVGREHLQTSREVVVTATTKELNDHNETCPVLNHIKDSTERTPSMWLTADAGGPLTMTRRAMNCWTSPALCHSEPMAVTPFSIGFARNVDAMNLIDSRLSEALHIVCRLMPEFLENIKLSRQLSDSLYKCAEDCELRAGVHDAYVEVGKVVQSQRYGLQKVLSAIAEINKQVNNMPYADNRNTA
ncbi:hypothetical protein Micbo1qcDRAFT_222218 [Microdochium bolleyi]|uniref:C2H2-type domain-containing protein n=1 Tax=Microdochium bolleyi TaxID=196109 RepID=A0A136IKA4_9PEZI|nr:hypothetical protein Micbo1qcDRAFT_222218 [Microdochium bolleyi]